MADARERPILFQGAMVRGLLAGTKTQTRRICKAKPREADGFASYGAEAIAAVVRSCSPYGKPGDRLWVREAFMHEPADYCWEASVSITSRPASTVYRADFPDSKPGEGWKPSIHMPRSLCRIELEITDVRIERLQGISDADAIAEGIEREEDGWRAYDSDTNQMYLSAVSSYRSLWDSINTKPGVRWADKPLWVWAVSFRRIKP